MGGRGGGDVQTRGEAGLAGGERPAWQGCPHHPSGLGAVSLLVWREHRVLADMGPEGRAGSLGPGSQAMEARLHPGPGAGVARGGGG